MEKPTLIALFLFFLAVLVFLTESVVVGDSNVNDKCRKDIQISQAATTPLPSGIPTYTVEITNVGASGRSISNIHVNCGKFSSANVIDPEIFKRLSYNDCLVNGGKPLLPGQTITFKYATTFAFNLTVSSVVCD